MIPTKKERAIFSMTLQTEPSSQDEYEANITTKETKDGYNILLQPLQEAKQTLHAFSSSYPSSGLDAWTLGYRLATLVDVMLQWGLWLHKPNQEEKPSLTLASTLPTETQDGSLAPFWQRLSENWEQLSKVWPPHSSFQPKEYPTFPMQLRAYCARHHALILPVFEEYGENDMELQELLTPAFALCEQMENQVVQWLQQQQMLPTPSWWMRWGVWIVAAVLLSGYSFYSYWTAPQIPPKQAGLPSGSIPGGIIGAYYNGIRFETLQQTRVDKTIWFDWKSSPISGVNADRFSVRWSGYIHAATQGTYRFCINHNDGAYVYVHSRTIIDKWKKASSKAECQTIALPKGWHRLIVQMNERSGMATAKLSWQPPNAKDLAKIEAKDLCCRNR